MFKIMPENEYTHCHSFLIQLDGKLNYPALVNPVECPINYGKCYNCDYFAGLILERPEDVTTKKPLVGACRLFKMLRPIDEFRVKSSCPLLDGDCPHCEHFYDAGLYLFYCTARA